MSKILLILSKQLFYLKLTVKSFETNISTVHLIVVFYRQFTSNSSTFVYMQDYV